MTRKIRRDQQEVPGPTFWMHAEGFFAAAEILRTVKMPANAFRLDEPMLSLYCHAMELGLKAYLRKEGKSIEELVNLGHDLERILAEAERLDLGKKCEIPHSLRFAAKVMTPLYSGKHLDYPIQGCFEQVSAEVLADICRKILPCIGRYCCARR